MDIVGLSFHSIKFTEAYSYLWLWENHWLRPKWRISGSYKNELNRHHSYNKQSSITRWRLKCVKSLAFPKQGPTWMQQIRNTQFNQHIIRCMLIKQSLFCCLSLYKWKYHWEIWRLSICFYSKSTFQKVYHSW